MVFYLSLQSPLYQQHVYLLQFELSKKNFYKLQDSLANFRDSNRNIKSDLFLNQRNRLEAEYNIAKSVYNELALNKEKTAIDVQKNTPIFTVINPVVVPNERYYPKRTQIVIVFIFLGVFLSVFWILNRNHIKQIILKFKS